MENIPEQVLPEELRSLDQWICWREEQRDGKATKVPVEPSRGSYASTTDPETWSDFESACDAVERPAVDGIGFVFTEADELVGVDLDDCRDSETGQPDEWVLDVIRTLESYTEVSPSGTGYHVIVEGQLPDGRNRSGNVEMYETARFFTVTGDRVSGTPSAIRERADALGEVHAQYVASDSAGADAVDSDPEMGERGGQAVDDRADTERTVDIPDEELLARAKAAKNGSKFRRLWNGGTSGYDSHSEADMALCCHLAFWTGGDAARMDRLFRESGLLREKWDEVHYADGSTYGEKTIERAVAQTDDVYDPSGDPGSSGETATGGTVQRGSGSQSDSAVRELEERMAAVEQTVEHLESSIADLNVEIEGLRRERMSETDAPDRTGDGRVDGWVQRLDPRR